MALTAPERETVILFSDDTDVATIHTHQRTILTKLRKNPAAVEIEDISFDGTPGAVFEFPVGLLSFRTKKMYRPGAGAHLHKDGRESGDSISRPTVRGFPSPLFSDGSRDEKGGEFSKTPFPKDEIEQRTPAEDSNGTFQGGTGI